MDFFEDLLDEDVGRWITLAGLALCGITVTSHFVVGYGGTDYAQSISICVGVTLFGISFFVSSLLHDRNFYLERKDRIWIYYLAMLVCTLGGSSASWILFGEDITAMYPIYAVGVVVAAGSLVIFILNCALKWIGRKLVKPCADKYYDKQAKE